MSPATAPPGEAAWPVAVATVTACTYDVRAGRALAFGLPSRKHFRITYDYWAGNTPHTGEFFSETAIPQGEVLRIRYDPTLPSRNEHSSRGALERYPRLAVGLIGSVVLSLAWLVVLRGCY